MLPDREDKTAPLLISPRLAAELLGVSEKTLWNNTAPRGSGIPAVRLGRSVRYSRVALEKWIESRTNTT